MAYSLFDCATGPGARRTPVITHHATASIPSATLLQYLKWSPKRLQTVMATPPYGWRSIYTGICSMASRPRRHGDDRRRFGPRDP